MSEIRMLRNSERSTLKRCPQRWHWSYNEGLKPNKVSTKLWFGTGVHEALAEWYKPGFKRGKNPVKTWVEFCDDQAMSGASAVWDDEDVEWHDAKTMGIYVLESYLDHYGKDRDWDVIATEQTFNLLVRKVARLVGTFDGVYRDRNTGEIWLMEHKTAAALSIKHLPLDPQAATYHYAATRALRKAGLIGPEEEIVGVMYNFLLKYMPPQSDRLKDEQGRNRNKPVKQHYLDAFEQKGLIVPAKPSLTMLAEIAEENGLVVYGDISKVQKKPIEDMFQREPVYKSRQERINTGKQIVADVELRQAFLDGTVPLVKNPTRDCSWDCDFYLMCQLHEAGEDWKSYRDDAYHKEDMYADHNNRKSA